MGDASALTFDVDGTSGESVDCVSVEELDTLSLLSRQDVTVVTIFSMLSLIISLAENGGLPDIFSTISKLKVIKFLAGILVFIAKLNLTFSRYLVDMGWFP